MDICYEAAVRQGHGPTLGLVFCPEETGHIWLRLSYGPFREMGNRQQPN